MLTSRLHLDLQYGVLTSEDSIFIYSLNMLWSFENLSPILFSFIFYRPANIFPCYCSIIRLSCLTKEKFSISHTFHTSNFNKPEQECRTKRLSAAQHSRPFRYWRYPSCSRYMVYSIYHGNEHASSSVSDVDRHVIIRELPYYIVARIVATI
jgi:hypothetical protein